MSSTSLDRQIHRRFVSRADSHGIPVETTNPRLRLLVRNQWGAALYDV